MRLRPLRPRAPLSTAARRALRALPLLAAGARGVAAQDIGATQITASLDLGAAAVAYDDFLRSGVVSVAPAVRFERPRTTFVARGAYSRFASGNESVQGTLAGSVVSPAFWNVRGELFATTSATRYRDITAATNLNGVGRVHWAVPAGGIWTGLGAGFVSQGQLFPDDLVQVEGGAWRRIGRTTYTATVTPTWIGPVSYTDWTGAMRWQHPGGEFAASGGYRAGAGGIPGARRWAEASATVWVARHLAVVGGGGVFPAEVLQGLPGGRYWSAALRLASRRPPVNDPALRAALTVPYDLGRLRRGRGLEATRFGVTVDPEGTRTIRVRVTGARRVELMADFTDWVAVPLLPTADGSEWVLSVFVAPGVHRVNVRVDGGPWIVPPGLTAVRDEFGGAAGLLVVQ